jgi:CRISP-associated protein Cas1
MGPNDEGAPLVRAGGLHALAYCERLYYLEQVEEIRLADERVYAGRALHAELAAEDDGECRHLTLSSESLGVSGEMDAVRRRDGQWYPYEHKKGKARRSGAMMVPWPSDRLQALAYALLLQEHLGEPVHEARIRYHEDHATIRVAVEDGCRAEVLAAVDRAREIAHSLERPPIHRNPNRCTHCSLAPACLPEEERAIDEPDWDTVRLFPAYREGKIVHLVTPGTSVGRSGEALVKRDPDGTEQVLPSEEVEALVLHGNTQITCARHAESGCTGSAEVATT